MLVGAERKSRPCGNAGWSGAEIPLLREYRLLITDYWIRQYQAYIKNGLDGKWII